MTATPNAELARRARERNRARRILVAGRLVAPLPTERHGTESTFNNWGCQCIPCTATHRDRQRVEAAVRLKAAQARLARIRHAAGRRHT
jgi:hypothetical protein